MDTTTTPPPQDTEEFAIGGMKFGRAAPVEETPQPSPGKAPNVNVTTLVVDAVRELRVDLRMTRALERIETNISWMQVVIILLVIEQLVVLIFLGVLIAR